MDYISVTKKWVEAFVIGMNLCPFAHFPFQNQQIRYALLESEYPEDLMRRLGKELELLMKSPPEKLETTLLIHPKIFTDFEEYLEGVEIAAMILEEMGLVGDIQIASFHPHYQFAGTQVDDVENFTNRSPFPMLHLLRENSVEKAIQSHPDTAAIPEQNIEKLRQLGHQQTNQKWKDLFSK